MNGSAGCCTVELFDQKMEMNFPVVVLYPAAASEHLERLGPYTLSVSMNAKIATGVFPLVVISHGTGGSHLVYRDMAAHLARNGLVVAMPEHPRNNRNNNDLAGTVENLENRPRHIRLVIDWAMSGEFGVSLKSDAVALIGHSLGGYTALAIAGGMPTAFAHETADWQSRKIAVTPDDRIKALVLLAPATVWFMEPGTLSGVHIPILMLTGEKDPHTPPFHAEIVRQGIAGVEHRVIANAGHFSFLSPFPASMMNPAFAPSQDPEGFDRAKFQEQLNADVLEFLSRELME